MILNIESEYSCPQCGVGTYYDDLMQVHYVGASNVEHYCCPDCGCIIQDTDEVTNDDDY